MRWLFLIFYTSFSLGEALILSPGEKTRIPLPKDQTVRLGDKSLLSFQIDNNQISLLAKKTGQTLVTAGNNIYKIFIFNTAKKTKALRLRQILSQLWGLNWSLSKNNEFEITGRLYRFSDWLELQTTSSQYNIPYQFKAQMDEELKKISSYYFKTALKLNIEIDWTQLPYVYIPSSSPPEFYKKISGFGLLPKEQESWFFKAPLIQLDLAVVESLSADLFSSGGTILKPLSFSSLLAFLNFLKSSGKGKTLHHSSLVAQSGKKLILKSGGQIPFNSWNLKTEQKNTNWKSHGLQIHLIPTVGKKEEIKLHIQAELSEPLSFSSSGQAPPLKTQNLESEFILSDKQILKLFQLRKKSKGHEYKGQFGALLSNPQLLLGGQNSYKMTQSLFIQAKILKEPNKLSSSHLSFESVVSPFRKKTSLPAKTGISKSLPYQKAQSYQTLQPSSPLDTSSLPAPSFPQKRESQKHNLKEEIL